MDTRIKNLAMVVAMAQNGVIGRKGDLPWKLRSDLQRFKAITEEHTVIMGRKTFESIRNRIGGPLPNRANVVVTRQPHYKADKVLIYRSLEEALAVDRSNQPTFVIGGAEIYQQALPLVSRIHMTHVHALPFGDTTFPDLDEHWTLTSKVDFQRDEQNEHDYSFLIYERGRQRKSFVYLNHARTPKQWCVMEKIFVAGVCPFCPGYLEKYHDAPILHENKCWLLTENHQPYLNTRVHLLAIHRRHAEHINEIGASDWSMLGSLIQWAQNRFELTSGGLAIRFGEPSQSGGSVKHLHVHLVTANITDPAHPDYKPVRFRVG